MWKNYEPSIGTNISKTFEVSWGGGSKKWSCEMWLVIKNIIIDSKSAIAVDNNTV